MIDVFPAYKLSAAGRDSAIEHITELDAAACTEAGMQYLDDENSLVHMVVQKLSCIFLEASHDSYAIATLAGAGAAYFAFREDAQPTPLVLSPAFRSTIPLPNLIDIKMFQDAFHDDPHLQDVIKTVSACDPEAFDLTLPNSPIVLGAGYVRLFLATQHVEDIILSN